MHGEPSTGGDLTRLSLELQGDLDVRHRRVALRDVGVGRAVIPVRPLADDQVARLDPALKGRGAPDADIEVTPHARELLDAIAVDGQPIPVDVAVISRPR